MNPKLTDEALADLPLSHGRADLLEEIMRTPVLDDRPVPADPRPRRGWLVPVAAAATVALLAGGVAWWAQEGTDPGASSGVASTPSTAPDPGRWVVLDAPGWQVTSAYVDATTGEVSWERGDESLEVTWYSADSYDGYVEDRRHITTEPRDGEPVEVLGLGGLLWDYSKRDHTVIREVEGERWYEFRGSGMGRADFLALLEELQATDQAGFDAAMPASFVSDSERRAQIDTILDEIEQAAGTALPAGLDRASVTSGQSDPYQLGADVTRAVTCAWIEEFDAARARGDDAAAQLAVDAMATAREWPVLDRMTSRGEWSQGIWAMADRMAAGEEMAPHAEGMGCEG